jgi:hypothetical protein
MPRDSDAENQASASEETPLLDSPEAEGLERKNERKRGPSFYILRVILAIMAAFILGVFIKGCIDGSDYADVGAGALMRTVFLPANFRFIVRSARCAQACPWRRS